MSSGGRQRLRLLLEGREVPVISATITGTENTPIVASIDLVPLQIIKFIRPRTQVHLFVRDDLTFGDDNYYIAFEGEVITRAFSKDAQGNRTFSVTAVDYSHYWQELKMYLASVNYAAGRIADQTVNFGAVNEGTEAAFLGTDVTYNEDTATSNLVQNIINNANPDLLAGVITAIQKLSNMNYYYSNAFSRLLINERMDTYNNRNLTQFFQAVVTDEFQENFIGRQSGLSSFTDVLMNVLGLIFHEYVSIPFPAYFPNTSEVNNFLFIPDCYAVPAPKCNMIFPNQVKRFTFKDDFTAAPTRMMYHFSQMFLNGGNQAGNATAGGLASTRVMVPAQYYPPSFYDFFFSTHTSKPSTPPALLDASSLYIAPNGATFAQATYGGKKSSAVGGVSQMPTLRDADFLTNDESLRGIIPDIVTFPPAIGALYQTSARSQAQFFGSIGQYMFFKKRFAPREADADLMFHPFLIPGFSTVLLDDSDLQQSITAKISTVSHTLTHEGHSTHVDLEYARDFDEVDLLNGGSGDPPPPPWLVSSVFGAQTPGGLPSSFVTETVYLYDTLKVIDAAEVQARSLLQGTVVYSKLNSFYQELIGCDAITDNGTNGSAIVTPRGAISYIYFIYRSKSGEANARDQFVRSYIKRPVPTMAQAMAFIGAVTADDNGDIPDDWALFEATDEGPLAGRFDGDGFPDANLLANRRQIIDQYRQQLRTQRGFRG